jgi:hypothetical protein
VCHAAHGGRGASKTSVPTQERGNEGVFLGAGYFFSSFFSSLSFLAASAGTSRMRMLRTAPIVL